jgi:nitrogen regulatory protein PII
MKMILAFLPPHRLEKVARRLQHLDGFPGMTVTEARGYGREKGRDDADAAAQLTDFTPTVRMEIMLSDDQVDEVLDVIYEVAHSGSRGDGKIFILPLSDALRIKTGERGSAAV